MENNSRVDNLIESISEYVHEQAWFQSLKSKWEELDPQSQLYLKIASAIGSVLAVCAVMFSFFWSVHKLKIELAEKTDLLHLIQNANTELTELKNQGSLAAAGLASGSGEPWPAYLSKVANTAGLGNENFTISDEKKEASTDLAKESLIELKLKRVNIRQLVRYAYSLENGNRPVKLRNLQIETKGDPSGYLEATLSISAYALQTNK